MSEPLESRRVSDRLLIVLSVTLVAVLLISVVVALAFWHTAPTEPIVVPMVRQA